jgi:hypothetical protein
MSHIKITVDGKTLMDADPGTWRETPPDIPALQSQTGGEPWGLAVMGAVAHAATLAMVGQSVDDATIAVTSRPGGFTMEADGVKPANPVGFSQG